MRSVQSLISIYRRLVTVRFMYKGDVWGGVSDQRSEGAQSSGPRSSRSGDVVGRHPGFRSLGIDRLPVHHSLHGLDPRRIALEDESRWVQLILEAWELVLCDPAGVDSHRFPLGMSSRAPESILQDGGSVAIAILAVVHSVHLASIVRRASERDKWVSVWRGADGAVWLDVMKRVLPCCIGCFADEEQVINVDRNG